MGGHEGGEVASRLAVDILSDHCAKSSKRLKARPGVKLASLRAMSRDLVLEWTQHANAEIYARTPENVDARARMGTTLALLLMVEDFVVIAHVGDSRVYRIRGGKIARLTEDHSIVGQAPPKRWGLPPRQRKFVTKALGTRPTVEPDIQIDDAETGDIYIMCSDGLSDLVKEPEIVKVLGKAGHDRRTGLRSLVELANKRGGRDNITVVLAEITGGDESDDKESTEALAKPIETPKPDKREASASRRSGRR